jgi:hypothetical protein
MMKYVARKTDLERDKYHDPKSPWLIVVEDCGKIVPSSTIGRFPSHRAANREIRRLVAVRVHQRP